MVCDPLSCASAVSLRTDCSGLWDHPCECGVSWEGLGAGYEILIVTMFSRMTAGTSPSADQISFPVCEQIPRGMITLYGQLWNVLAKEPGLELEPFQVKSKGRSNLCAHEMASEAACGGSFGPWHWGFGLDSGPAAVWLSRRHFEFWPNSPEKSLALGDENSQNRSTSEHLNPPECEVRMASWCHLSWESS